jgi:hypothetical protein
MPQILVVSRNRIGFTQGGLDGKIPPENIVVRGVFLGDFGAVGVQEVVGSNPAGPTLPR